MKRVAAGLFSFRTERGFLDRESRAEWGQAPTGRSIPDDLVLGEARVS